MARALVTGGSGFIASHILKQLIGKGHRVVTTVRSQEKAQRIRETYLKLSKDELEVVVVPDIAQPGAFDEVVKIPDTEIVFHTASPFHYNWSDPYMELIDPAINGTLSILKAVARSAESVRRVIVTSSFAAILDEAHFTDPKMVFTENSWNPVTLKQIHSSKPTAYRLSKTLAERTAWDFVMDPANKAEFDLVVVNPPLVTGPILHHLGSLSAINTSNKPIVDCITGKWKSDNEVSPTGPSLNYVDVRDVADAHIRAGLEIPDAAGKRLFPTGGMFSNRMVLDIVRDNFPEYADKLPPTDVKGGEFPPRDQVYGYDNSKSTKLLGIKWMSFEQSVIDTVKSLKAWGA